MIKWLQVYKLLDPEQLVQVVAVVWQVVQGDWQGKQFVPEI